MVRQKTSRLQLADATVILAILLENLAGPRGRRWLAKLSDLCQREGRPVRSGAAVAGHTDDDSSADAAVAEARPRQFLDTTEAAFYMRVTRNTLAQRRHSGDTPPYYKFGAKVLYDRAEIDAWLVGRRRHSTPNVDWSRPRKSPTG